MNWGHYHYVNPQPLCPHKSTNLQTFHTSLHTHTVYISSIFTNPLWTPRHIGNPPFSPSCRTLNEKHTHHKNHTHFLTSQNTKVCMWEGESEMPTSNWEVFKKVHFCSPHNCTIVKKKKAHLSGEHNTFSFSTTKRGWREREGQLPKASRGDFSSSPHWKEQTNPSPHTVSHPTTQKCTGGGRIARY